MVPSLLPPFEPSGTMVWWAADGVENLTGHTSPRAGSHAMQTAITRLTLTSAHALRSLAPICLNNYPYPVVVLRRVASRHL